MTNVCNLRGTMDYLYLMPTALFFGQGCIRIHESRFAAYGKKALIVTGKTSARACGALADVCAALDRQQVAWVLYEAILPNPSIFHVREAAHLARTQQVDLIIGIGGGSPMDAAKAVALLATNDLDDATLFSGNYPAEPLPVLVVPTTAGTGSEVTPYAILTDVNDQTKKNLAHPGLFPRAAFLDSRYLEALPFEGMVHTALDALSHAVESYLSARNTAMSAMFALEAIRCVGPGLIALAGGEKPEGPGLDRILHGSMLAGMAIAQTGTTMVHAMGYSLTFFHHMDHGKANAVLLCQALRFCFVSNSDKIRRILGILDMETIDELQAMFDGLIGRPQALPDDQLVLFTQKAMATKSIANTVPEPSADDILGVYRRALGQEGTS